MKVLERFKHDGIKVKDLKIHEKIRVKDAVATLEAYLSFEEK